MSGDAHDILPLLSVAASLTARLRGVLDADEIARVAVTAVAAASDAHVELWESDGTAFRRIAGASAGREIASSHPPPAVTAAAATGAPVLSPARDGVVCAAFPVDGRRVLAVADRRDLGTVALEALRVVAAAIDAALHAAELGRSAANVSEHVSARRRAEQLAAELEQKRAALVESEARSRRLQDSGVIGVVFWTRDGVLVDANDAFLRMVGYTREDLESGNVRWREMTPPEFAELDTRAFAEMELHGFCRPYEKEYIHRDGRRIPISLGVAFWEGSTTSGVAWILDISERKAIERERERAVAGLEQARTQLQSLIDHAPAAIFLKDLDGRFILANKTAAAVAGRSPEDLLGKTNHDVLPLAIADALRRDDERVIRQEEPIEIEEEALVGGERRFAHTVKFPVRAQDGRIYATGGFSLDITERKRLEDALTLQSRVLQSMAEGVSVSDEHGVIVFTNPAEDAMFGYAPGELVGRHVTVQNAYPQEENARIVAEVIARLEEHGVWSGEFQNVKKDGTPFVTRARITTLELSGRRHFVCVQADVTDERRRQADAAFLARVGEELASSLDLATVVGRVVRLCVAERCGWCAVYTAPPAGGLELLKIVHADAARTRVLERLHVDHPGVRRGPPSSGHLVLRDRGAEDLGGFEALLAAAGSPAFAWMLRVQGRTTGAIVFGARSDDPFEDADRGVLEELGRRLAVTIDHVQLFETTQRERRRAEEASRAKDELLSVTSHELRTPLNAIVGWAAMLRGGGLPEDKRTRALATIERNARAQVQLVDDILDVSRVFTGKLRLEVSWADPKVIVEQALDVVRPAAEAKGVGLHVVLADDVGHVHGDAGRLQQVCWNLLSNAVKFTPKGGRVTVILRRHDSDVELVVSDTGRGIDPGFLPHVFEPFRQEDGSMTRVHGGLGLGLAIVKHLIELHGGRVTASSEGAGKGATFVMRIPVSPVTPTPPVTAPRDRVRGPEDAPFSCPPQLRGLRVLVIDDEPDARELVESILAQCHAEVTLAPNAADGFEKFRRSPPDVVISDIGMGGESGYDLIVKLRALPPELGGRVPAIALTAYAGAADRTRALTLGFTAHATKPMDPRELIALVSAVVGRNLPGAGP